MDKKSLFIPKFLALNLSQAPIPGEGTKSRFADNFNLGPVLGKGAYAPVHLAVHKVTGKSVAVKIYQGFRQMEREKRALVTREVQIMRKLQHENIVKFAGTFNEPQAIYIVMQHLSGGSLYGLVRNHPKGHLSEDSARRLFMDVAKGVAYLHSQSVVHRDLKLDNMLLDDKGRVRLIDFGFASLLKPGVKCRMACGTPSYMPPEILKKGEYEGTAADMWSLGVVLYAMLHGCYPFKGQKPEELYANIAAGEYTVSQSLSSDAKTLLHGLLSLNPEGRLKAEQVLASPWHNRLKKHLSGAIISDTNPPFLATNAEAFAYNLHSQTIRRPAAHAGALMHAPPRGWLAQQLYLRKLCKKKETREI
ncbi:hypothetical protein Esti_006185 [Eimeria stiedai]